MERCERSSALRTSAEAEPSADGNGKSDIRSDQADEESNILKNLFDAQGVHSAINHDAIMRAAEAFVTIFLFPHGQEELVLLEPHPLSAGNLGRHSTPSCLVLRGHQKVQSLQVGALHGKALSSAELLSKMRGTREGATSDALEHPLSLGSASNRSKTRPDRERAHIKLFF